MSITAARLVEAREARGLSVLDLAVEMRVQTAQIYDVESGRRNAGPSLLRRYVAAGVLPRDEVATHLLGPEAAA